VVNNTSGGQDCTGYGSPVGLVGCGAAGVYGVGTADGVLGYGITGDGVYGIGTLNGVFGETSNNAASGVYGQNDATGYGAAGEAAHGTGCSPTARTALPCW